MPDIDLTKSQRAMLQRGVHFHLSRTDHFSLSTAHTAADVAHTLAVSASAVAEIAPQSI
jgi:glutamate-1-semialdehyde aminotransferase